MDVFIAIFVALGGYASPSTSIKELKAKDPILFEHAEKIMDNHLYHIDTTSGIVIIDETGERN
jgi:hypothetical protein